jgi:integrase
MPLIAKPYNTLLEYYDAQARAYVSQCYIKQKTFSIEEFHSTLFGKICTDDFFEFVEREIVADNTCSEATRRTYRAKMNKLRRFRPKLAISEAAEYGFLMDYKKEMIRSGNALNTWNEDLKIIRSFLNRAKTQGLIDSHAFLDGKIRLRSEDGSREALTLAELQRLRKLYQSAQLSNRHRRALQQFLFSCYTGLHYQDLHDLTWGEVKDGIITHVQHKTQDTVRIPLCNEFLDKFLHFIPAYLFYRTIFAAVKTARIATHYCLPLCLSYLVFTDVEIAYCYFVCRLFINITIAALLVGAAHGKGSSFYQYHFNIRNGLCITLQTKHACKHK